MINLNQLSILEKAELLSTQNSSAIIRDISWSMLGLQKCKQIIKIIKECSETVRALNLSANMLDHLLVPEFIRILRAIPESVEALNLAANGLGFYQESELIEIITNIGLNVEALDLSSNQLVNFIANDGLANILSMIPKSVKVLNLSKNLLNSIFNEDFSVTISSIPETVHVLIFDDLDDVFTKQAHDKLVIFFHNLPSSIQYLKVKQNVYTPPSDYLVNFIFPSSQQYAFFEAAFSSILDDTKYSCLQPTIIITDSLLLILIDIFERTPSFISDLLIAVLLLDFIKVHFLFEEMPNNLYIQDIRQSYALLFLRRSASKAPEAFSQIISDFVMHLKYSSPIDSIIYQKLYDFKFRHEYHFAEGVSNKSDFLTEPSLLPSINIKRMQRIFGAERLTQFSLFHEKEDTLPQEFNPQLKRA